MLHLRYVHVGLNKLSFNREAFKGHLVSGDLKPHTLVNYRLALYFGKRCLYTFK